MQFTSSDLKLIERLRKQERQWRWLRWASLGVSLFTFGCYGYIGVSLYKRLHWEGLTIEDAVLIAIYWPKVMLGMCLASAFLVWPLAHWRGNAARILLLKLLDAQVEIIA